MDGTVDLRPLVFVTVGTDHHPFDRLVRWVDAWLASGEAEGVRCLVQYGTSVPPTAAEGRDYLGYQEMEANLSEAAAVVTHGGPGSVMMCRWAGKTPIVVARRRNLGEHVDDHQVVFTRRMATEGELIPAEDEAAFRSELSRALRGTEVVDLRPGHRAMDALDEFERLVGSLFGSPVLDRRPVAGEAEREGARGAGGS